MSTAVTKKRFNIQHIPLANGSTLYYQHMAGAPRVALEVFIQGGNRLEPQAGIADMVEDLTTEGTKTRSAKQIANDIDALSLDFGTDTYRDYSNLNATFLPEDMDASLEILADLLLQSTLAEFEKSKMRMQGELTMELDSPVQQSRDLLLTTIFKNTPYQATHTNMLQTLSQIQGPEELHAYYQKIYTPANMAFCVVGDIPAETVKTCIEKHFVGNTGECFANTNAPEPPTLDQDHYMSKAKEGSNQLHIYKAWFAPYHQHTDYYPMLVMNTALGAAGLSSRLFIELRDKQGLAYTVRSQFESSKYLGLFSLYIGTEPKNREQALNGFKVECQKLMDTPMSAKELEETKENIIGRRTVYLETAHQQCGYIGTKLSLGLTQDDLNAYYDNVRAVSADSIQQVAQKYLTQPSVVSAVGPQEFL